MVVRNALIGAVLAVAALSVATDRAMAAEPAPPAKTPVPLVAGVDQQAFRSELDGYIRELNLQMRNALSDELRRAVPAKVEVASNGLRARG